MGNFGTPIYSSFTPTKNYPALSGLLYPTVTPTTINTDAVVTYTTAQVLSGLILRNITTTARTDVMPTAALLVAAVEGAQANTAFYFTLKNTTSTSHVITVAAGTGGTTSGTMTIDYLTLRQFLVVFTNTTPGSEAYTLYSLGVLTF